MVEHAPERPCHSSPRPPVVGRLPYDPEDWERRVAVARAQREEVLQQRADERRRAAEREPVVSAVDADGPESRRAIAPDQGASRPGDISGDVQPKAAASAFQVVNPSHAPADKAQVVPSSHRFESRLRPMLFGLVAGCLAGASIASLAATGFGFVGLQSLSVPLLSSPPDASLDAAPAHAARRQPLKPHLPASFMDLGAMPSHVPRLPALAPIVALTIPSASASASGAEQPALSGAVLTASLPAISSAPSTLEPPVWDASQRIATLASDTAYVNANRALSARAPQLALPQMPQMAFVPEEAIRPPELQISRVAVHAPERLESYSRELAMARLSEIGFPTTQIITPYTISETHIRYFHAQDQAAAEKLAIFLDSGVRDFTSFSPSPDDGYLELWLGGQGAPPQARPVVTRTVAPVTNQITRTNRGSGRAQTSAGAVGQVISGGKLNERRLNSWRQQQPEGDGSGNGGSSVGGSNPEGSREDRGGSGNNNANGGGSGSSGADSGPSGGNGNASGGGNRNESSSGNGSGGRNGNGGGNGSGNSGGNGNGNEGGKDDGNGGGNGKGNGGGNGKGNDGGNGKGNDGNGRGNGNGNGNGGRDG